MFVTRLALSDFRSYADALVEPGPGLVILTGDNGAGKTNLLEAVSLLAPGRGLRGASLSEMARQGSDGGFAVAARLAPPLEGERLGRGGVSGDAERVDAPPPPKCSPSRGRACIDIGTGVLASAPERRQVRINGASASSSSLAEWLSVLWLTPAMDRLFVEGASGRRRFLDRLTLALFPGHAVHAARYEAAMRARNKLLAEERSDEAWLTALEARMGEHGAALAEARATTVGALSARLADAPDGPFARAGLALDRGASDDLARDLAKGRARDAAAGRTLDGPHRSDLIVTHVDKNQPATGCSTGEQKALLLGIILAHADLVADRSGRRPILLLDEVAAHLDPLRRGALIGRLEAAGGQVWVTGTEPALFECAGLGSTRLEIAGGRVAPR
ncbi:MAG TPA: DNA replication/repair protein RecF [Allosphingosinicella sp.]|nr:DNA replication/repair protein RecF [Allosphingosinicella sp.]